MLTTLSHSVSIALPTRTNRFIDEGVELPAVDANRALADTILQTARSIIARAAPFGSHFRHTRALCRSFTRLPWEVRDQRLTNPSAMRQKLLLSANWRHVAVGYRDHVIDRSERSDPALKSCETTEMLAG
jgi:hypothetical protein